MQHIRRIRPSIAVLAVALSSLSLYACGQNNQQAANTAAPPALPLTTGAETAPVYAPPVSALPSAPRPKIVRVASQADQYAYVDQAQTMGAAIGSAPPDYGFDYDGVRPWVWRTGNNALRLVEPINGGYRYYYYQPGAALPYLIQDPQYAYGFDNGQLVVVYDGRGNVLPPQYMDERIDYAGRYLARAQALYNASLQNQRSSVIAANWAARRAAIDAQQAEWADEQSQYSAWQAYHQEHEAEQQAYWQAERQRRDAAAAQFNQWQNAGYQGPPPPPYAGVAGAAAVGGLIGGLIAGQHHDHDNGGPPPQNYPPQGGYGRPGGPGGFNAAQGAPYGGQQAAVQQARQQQAEQDAQRQAQAQQQAQAAAAARAQAIQQGRQQEAAQYAAQQATAQQQARQIAAARSQQAAQDAAAQRQQQAAAQRQAMDAQRAQNQQAHQQQMAQAEAQHQAQAAARAQAHEQQAAQAAAQHQAQAAEQAQAQQAHEQQAAQAAAQRQAEASARAQAAQAHQQQAAQAAAQHQAQAAQAAQAAAAARATPHAPPPGGHDPKRDGEPHPTPN